MRIQWDTGSTNSYRMGKEGKYDLKLAGPPPVPESSEEEEEDMKGAIAENTVLKQATSQLAYLEKLSLIFFSSSSVIRVNLLHP